MKLYPDCPHCESNESVDLSTYADGAWIGFECTGCYTVVQELYNADTQAPENIEPDPRSAWTVTVPFEAMLDVTVMATSADAAVEGVRQFCGRLKTEGIAERIIHFGGSINMVEMPMVEEAHEHAPIDMWL